MSYELGDFIIDIAFATSIIMCFGLIVSRKKNKFGMILLSFAMIGMYTGIDLLVRVFPEGTLENDLAFMACCLIEMISVWICMWLGTTGDLWRNYFIVTIYGIFVSVSGYLISALIPAMTEAINVNSICQPGVDLMGAFGFLMLTIGLAFGFALIFRLIFKKEYYKKGKIYKIITIVYSAYALWNALYRRALLIRLHIDDGEFTDFDMNVISIVTVILLVIGLNLVGYSYNKMEQKRLAKEKVQLKAIMDQKLEQYQNVLSDNNELFRVRDAFVQNVKEHESDVNKDYISEIIGLSEHTVNQSLMGSAVIDSVLSINRRKMKVKDIAFETNFDMKSVDDLKSYMDESELAIIIDGLLQLAMLCASKSNDDRYIVITERKEAGPLVMRIDVSRPSNMSITLRKLWEMSFMKRIGMDKDSQDKYLLAHKVLELNQAVLKIKNTVDMTSIIMILEMQGK